MKNLCLALVLMLVVVCQLQAVDGTFCADGQVFDYRAGQNGTPYTGWLTVRVKAQFNSLPGVPQYQNWAVWAEDGKYHLYLDMTGLEHATQLEYEVQDEPGTYYTSGGGFAFWAVYNGMTINAKTFTLCELVGFNN